MTKIIYLAERKTCVAVSAPRPRKNPMSAALDAVAGMNAQPDYSQHEINPRSDDMFMTHVIENIETAYRELRSIPVKRALDYHDMPRLAAAVDHLGFLGRAIAEGNL